MQRDLLIKTGAWPSNTINPVKIPLDIQTASDTFNQFYTNKYSGRKLHWQLDRGSAEVVIQFNATTRKTLVVSTYQMIVLLLFNDDKSIWTFKEIMDTTKIPRDDAFHAVMSMAHPKIKVMRKAPNTKEIADDDKFQINPKYNNAKCKISIPTHVLKSESTEKKKQSMEQILKLRRYRLDAAIIRVMKERKILHHCDVYVAVKWQLRQVYDVEMKDFRQRIKNLFDLEYILIKKQDNHIYKYSKNGVDDEFGDSESKINPCNGCNICDKKSDLIPKAQQSFEQRDWVKFAILREAKAKSKKLTANNELKANDEEIVITIKQLNGNKEKLKVNKDATVKLLRLLLVEKLGIPLDGIRLIQKGKLLNDTQQLDQIGVIDGDIIHMATTGCFGG